MEKVYTDHTLKGDGTQTNKLSIASVTRTGSYSPVNDYCDFTAGENLPEPEKIGHRTLVKMPLDRFGKLYTDAELERIVQLLSEEGSEWRIPTKNDWDELLNAVECPEDRNHNSNELGICLGKNAGKVLKSSELWEDNIQTEGVDNLHMSVLPTHSDSYTAFWTNTKESNKYYIKEFTSDCDGVKQDLFDEEKENFTDSYYPAIRLVKDYDGSNYNMVEKILGDYYLTSLVINPHGDDSEYAKIWTIINLRYEDDQVDGFVDENWDDSVFPRESMFAIFEWNGVDYDSIILLDGEFVVIKKKDDKENREYMVWGNEIIDTHEELDSLSAATVNIENRLNDNITSLDNLSGSTIEIKENVETNRGNIEELSGATTGIDNYISSFKEDGDITEKIDVFFGENASVLLRSFILNVLEGIDGEIKLQRDPDGKIKFGFADNAVFGPIDEE